MFFDKKIKYERIDYKMIIEDTFCDYLSERAREGWIFTGIYVERIGFKYQEPQDIKYQIEYGTLDYDYEDFLKENGYEGVCQFKRMIIFRNYNIHAPDLHSDDYVRLQAVKHMMSKHPILIFTLLSFLCLPILLVLNAIPEKFTSLGAFLKNMFYIPFGIFLIVLLCSVVLMTAQSIVTKNIVNKLIDGKKVNYRMFDVINKVVSVNAYVFSLFCILCVPFGLVVILKNGFSYHILSLVFRIGILGICILVAKFMMKYRIEKKFIIFIMTVFGAITVITGEEFIKPLQNDESIKNAKIDAYMKEDSSYSQEDSLLYDCFSYSYNPENLWNPIKYELFETYVTEFMAKEIMKDDIVEFERETRASNEYIENYIKENGFYTSSYVEKKSYEDALATLTEYNHNLVEECYYNEHFFIARKNNKILVSYIQDEANYMANVIEHYFK